MHIAKPHLPAALSEVINLRQLLLDDETLSGVIARDETVKIKAQLTTNETRLEKICLSESTLEKSSLTDTTITSCDLTATVLSESSWRRVHIQSTRGGGMQLASSTLKDVTFDGCKLNLVNFRFCKLRNVTFSDCVLDEADFYMAELEHVRFMRCTMTATQFSGAKLRYVDLRTSDISAVMGVGSLSGATIDSMQLITLAPLLAASVRIIVSDE